MQLANMIVPLVQAIVGGLTVGGFTYFAIHKYNVSVNEVRATLEFSKRYQELFHERHNLNKRFRAQSRDRRRATAWVDDEDAKDWYRQYFDLILNEHRFLGMGLIDEEVFTQWMRWSRENVEDATFTTCGMSYRRGWDWWEGSEGRAVNRDFESVVPFLRKIHTRNGGDIRLLVHLEVREQRRGPFPMLKKLRLPMCPRRASRN